MYSQFITMLDAVVLRVDNAIHQINHYPVDTIVGLLTLYIQWILMYLVDIVIL